MHCHDQISASDDSDLQMHYFFDVHRELFAALDRVEDILSKSRYLAGDQLTEADVRLFMCGSICINLAACTCGRAGINVSVGCHDRTLSKPEQHTQVPCLLCAPLCHLLITDVCAA